MVSSKQTAQKAKAKGNNKISNKVQQNGRNERKCVLVEVPEDGNQDKPKFIGGAERARRNAQRAMKQSNRKKDCDSSSTDNRSSISSERERVIPRNVRPTMDRFFGCLLSSKTKDIADFESGKRSKEKVILNACVRAGIPYPGKLPSSYDDARQYYNSLSGQILLESFAILSSEMAKRKRERRQLSPNAQATEVNGVLRLTLHKCEVVEEGGKIKFRRVRFLFYKETSMNYVSERILFDDKPGTCYQLMPVNVTENEKIDSLFPVLATVSGQPNFSEKHYCLTVYDKDILLAVNEIECEEWIIYPMCSLISEARQFDACQLQPKVCFMNKILGLKKATHVRFVDNDDGEVDEEVTVIGTAQSTCNENLPMLQYLPKLNPTQERLIKNFLASDPSTLSLVQGPPGTGKTTFLVSLITHYLYRYAEKPRRLMVCAPSNKAVNVIATRFLHVLENSKSDIQCNVIVIGVHDKLLENNTDYLMKQSFAYTWLDCICNELSDISVIISNQPFMDCQKVQIIQRIQVLRVKLSSQISYLLVNQDTIDNLDRAIHLLNDDCIDSNKCISELETAVASLRWLNIKEVVKTLLSTANVIFCTLSTAGSSFVKYSKKIDDLLIDEAAQSTEGEIVIPFILKPQRILAVGDPMQLPATIISPDAVNNGFHRSLHERLMFRIGYDYAILDVQYRMKPCISLFPSGTFYSNMIQNGNNVIDSNYKGDNVILDGTPFVFIDVKGQELQHHITCSFYNQQEAHVTLQLLRVIRTRSVNKGDWCCPERVRVITFYQGQVSCIKNVLSRYGMQDVVVSTVDSSQGCEADIIILSFTRSNNQGNKGFVVDSKRLNVSLTRAKYQLICIGDGTGTLELTESDIQKGKRCVVSSLVKSARERNVFYSESDLEKYLRL